MHPNKGPELELYFAEEAVGLVKSLDWHVVPGPGWQQEYTDQINEEMQEDGEDEKSISDDEYGSDGYMRPEVAK
jgi:hypothetical protein